MTKTFLRKNIGKALLFLAFTTAISLPFTNGEASDSEAAIAAAKKSLLNAYLQVQNAENVGADVTSLLNTLNEANSLLYAAELAYARNDSSSAYELAVQSQNQLSNFASQVTSAIDVANAQRDQSFLITVLSLVGSFAIVILGIYGWIYIDKKNNFSREQNDQSQPI